jgi:hypothetical protein
VERIPLGVKVLNEKVAALRAGLDADYLKQAAWATAAPVACGCTGKLFDLGLAHELHAALLGPSPTS